MACKKVNAVTTNVVKDCNGEKLCAGDYVVVTDECPLYMILPESDIFQISRVYKKPYSNGTNCCGKLESAKDPDLAEKSHALSSKWLRKLSCEELNAFKAKHEKIQAELDKKKKAPCKKACKK